MKIKVTKRNTQPQWLTLAVGVIRGHLESCETWEGFYCIVNSVLDDLTITVRNSRYSGSSIKREFSEEDKQVTIYTSTGQKVACVIEIETLTKTE